MKMPEIRIEVGDVLEVLGKLCDGTVNCVVTSPPYWGLRDYGVDGQIGLEATPEEYVEKMVRVFREVRRVLRDDGTCWVNLGDSYAGGGRGGNPEDSDFRKQATNAGSLVEPSPIPCGLKAKDLVGIPWRVAFALQADGWWLRQDIIWHKPNPMPESVTDRCTKAHEYVFLLTKSARYWYDAEVIKEPQSQGTHERFGKNPQRSSKRKLEVPGVGTKNNTSFDAAMVDMILPDGKRNKRSVWTVTSQPYKEAHFATFPEALVRPMILAGCPVQCCPKCGVGWERIVRKSGGTTGKSWHDHKDDLVVGQRGGKTGRGWETDYKVETLGFAPTCTCDCDETVPGTVLDPFGGSGTVGKVAIETGRNAVLIELNPKYAELAKARTNVTAGFSF